MTFPAPYTLGVYPDVLGDVRTWLRAHPWMPATVNGRVFFRIPDAPTFPLIRVYDAGTTQTLGEVAPLVTAQIGVDVWGAIGVANATYGDVKTIAHAVAAAFHFLQPGTLLGTTTVALDGEAGTFFDNPDPDTGAPRKTGTCTLYARAKTDNG